MSLRFTRIHYWRDSLHWLCRLQCAFVGSALQLRQTAQRRSHEIGWLLMWYRPLWKWCVSWLKKKQVNRMIGTKAIGELQSCQLKGKTFFFAKTELMLLMNLDGHTLASLITNLISNARIVAFRIMVFFQETQMAQKCKKVTFWPKYVPCACRLGMSCISRVFFEALVISGNGWLMN